MGLEEAEEKFRQRAVTIIIRCCDVGGWRLWWGFQMHSIHGIPRIILTWTWQGSFEASVTSLTSLRSVSIPFCFPFSNLAVPFLP